MSVDSAAGMIIACAPSKIWLGVEELLPLDLRKLRKHYSTRSSVRHGLPEPRLTWMSPGASCGPGCRQSMPA